MQEQKTIIIYGEWDTLVELSTSITAFSCVHMSSKTNKWSMCLFVAMEARNTQYKGVFPLFWMVSGGFGHSELNNVEISIFPALVDSEKNHLHLPPTGPSG